MIAWKQSARLGTWMVHQYDHTVEPAVTVLLNMDTREEPERIEAAYSIARTVCATLMTGRSNTILQPTLPRPEGAETAPASPRGLEKPISGAWWNAWAGEWRKPPGLLPAD